MSEITSLSQAYHWNLTKLADAFGLHRDTVRKRLKAAGISPVGRKGNAELYALSVVGPALFATGAMATGGEINNPDDMVPKERKDWYQSENERLKFQKEERELIPITEHRDGMVVPLKEVVSFFDSLPDKMERRRCFTAEQLDELEAATDVFRMQLYNQLSELDDEQLREK